MIGASLNFLPKDQLNLRRANQVLVAAILCMLASRALGQTHLFSADLITTISAASIIYTIAFACPPKIKDLLEQGLFLRLGKSSYSCYLLNPIILFLFSNLLAKLNVYEPTTELTYLIYAVIFGAVTTIATIPISIAFSQTIESHSIRAGRSVERYIRRALAPAAARNVT